MRKLIIFVVLSVTFNMAIDKSWIQLPDRLCAEYQAGVKAFVERCWDYSDEHGEVRCPCRCCNNCSFQNLDTVEAHLLDWGFQEVYTTRIFHGEQHHPDSEDDSDEKTEDENDRMPDSGSGLGDTRCPRHSSHDDRGGMFLELFLITDQTPNL